MLPCAAVCSFRHSRVLGTQLRVVRFAIRPILFFPPSSVFFSNIRFFCRLSAPHAIFSSNHQPLKPNRPQSPCFGVSSTLFKQSYFANERWRADFLMLLDGLIETERNLQINVFSNWRVRRFQNKTAPYFVRLFGRAVYIYQNVCPELLRGCFFLKALRAAQFVEPGFFARILSRNAVLQFLKKFTFLAQLQNCGCLQRKKPAHCAGFDGRSLRRQNGRSP